MAPRYFEQPELAYRSKSAFCVIGNPYDRAISEYRYQLATGKCGDLTVIYGREPCSEEGLNYFLQETLTRMRSGDRYVNGCRMVPQYQYVWGLDRQCCNEVVRAENLPGAFSRLMQKYNYPLNTLDQGYHSCPDLSRANLTNATRDLLNVVYADDFRLLQYTAY